MLYLFLFIYLYINSHGTISTMNDTIRLLKKIIIKSNDIKLRLLKPFLLETKFYTKKCCIYFFSKNFLYKISFILLKVKV